MPKPITIITRVDCEKIRPAVIAALGKVEEEFGLKLVSKNGKFDSNRFTFPIEFATVGKDGTVNSAEALSFKQFSSMYGVDQSALNTKITLKTGVYTLIGLKSRCKLPFIALREDGVKFRLSGSAVKFASADALITADHVKGALNSVMKTPEVITPGRELCDGYVARW